MRPETWLVVAIVVVAGCGVRGEVAQPAPVTPSPTPGPALPHGFRWESYGSAQVAVPDEWGWESGSQRLGQWCLGIDAGPRDPAVGRPGSSTEVGCPAGDPRETLVDATGEFVAFLPVGDHTAADAHTAETEGDRAVVELGETRLIVQAEAGLRERILESAHRIDTDYLGCPVSPPLVDDADWTPTTEFPTEASEDIRLVACGYTAGGGEPGLTGSIELAPEVVGAIARAPEGSGPNDPSSCLSTGGAREVVVLRASSGGGRSDELLVRYGDCRDAGFYDGGGVRQLTPESVAGVFAGPLLPDYFAGHHRELFRPLLESRFS
ncbi:hypothetical protein [Aeromicrobium sp. PE09-221]|uniref:hypothetical protein n=1 Tax=Aeromicrobium sp. PE09-221 TaxID=1898043 RepID=UPI00111D4C0A|nr:hypothetical protein [Aeromicrobium sp. PE09-221]